MDETETPGGKIMGEIDFEDTRALPYHEVLRRELHVIDIKRGDKTRSSESPEPTGTGHAELELEQSQRALHRDLAGLAFSGGGIRSATFNLGILQALSDMRLLSSFDYLSTVSGGGYIGSWLSGLVARENHAVDNGDPERRFDGINQVQKRLQARRSQDQDVEDSAVSFLRQYSNYLTPKLGLLSADTWALVATYLRNLLLNLLVLIPGIACILMIPWVLFGFTGVLQHEVVSGENGVWLFGFSLVAGVLATAKMGYNMASLVDARPSEGAGNPTRRAGRSRFLEVGWIQSILLAPLVVGAVLTSLWMPKRFDEDSAVRWAITTGIAYAMAWILATAVALASRWQGRQGISLWLWLILAAAGCGGVGGFLLYLVAERFVAWGETPYLVAYGPPLVLLWLALLGTVQTGVMGQAMLDRQREWMSRLGAWLLIAAVSWAALFAAVVHGPVLLMGIYGYWQFAVAGGWVASILGGLLASRGGGGNGAGFLRRMVLTLVPYVFIAGLLLQLAIALSFGLGKTQCHDDDGCWEAFEGVRTTFATEHGAHGALKARAAASDADAAESAYDQDGSVTFGALLGRLQAAHNEIIQNVAITPADSDAVVWRHFVQVVLAALALLVIAFFLAWRIDVNEFSMHSFYRNRLVRAYLGASVEEAERREGVQAFTGFYRGDDIPLAGVVDENVEPGEPVRVDVAKPGPFHIVNTALNLVAGEQLAWQERKADSFILTPLYSGFKPPDEATGTWEPTESAKRRKDGKDGKEGKDSSSAVPEKEVGPKVSPFGYRRATHFASKPKKLSLGSAFATSGAAASPNMGFRSTPALSFLLTVFNVRLGWWLGNPRRKKLWTRSGPKIALLHLFQEVLGRTRGRTKYVYLSDGAHFENLGLYELVRRRCRFIVVTDAGADPKLALDDIGNAIRKCRADLGADIDLDLTALQEDENGLSARHCAVGTIRYLREREEGRILFIKATVTGDESADILNYRRQHPSFPHETTGDQFFGESQFESYRQLGHHIATSVLGQAVERATDRPGVALTSGANFRWRGHELGRMWRRVEEYWMPPALVAGDAFIRHAIAVDALLDRLRNTDELRFLDSQVYPEWHRLLEGTAEVDVTPDTLWLPDSAESRRHGFYFCVEMIQLMENIYIDLDLDKNWNSGDNSGWMNYFHHWAWSGMFRVTWAITAATFGQRFRSFVRDHLGLDLGSIELRSLSGPSILEDLDREENKTFLNFLEREQVGLFLGYDGHEYRSRDARSGLDLEARVPRVERLVRMELVVAGAVGVEKSTSTDELLRFGVGYALFDENGRLLLFRIQDHLREMGLGTSSLRRLMETEALGSTEDSIAWAREFKNIRRLLDHRISKGVDNDAAHRRFVEEFRHGGRRLITRLRAAQREVRGNEHK